MSTDRTPGLSADDLEIVYAAIAGAIDKAGPERDTLMLTRLALLLAHEIGDRARFEALLDEALMDCRPAERCSE